MVIGGWKTGRMMRRSRTRRSVRNWTSETTDRALGAHEDDGLGDLKDHRVTRRYAAVTDQKLRAAAAAVSGSEPMLRLVRAQRAVLTSGQCQAIKVRRDGTKAYCIQRKGLHDDHKASGGERWQRA
jgi:hypothetical protein